MQGKGFEPMITGKITGKKYGSLLLTTLIKIKTKLGIIRFLFHKKIYKSLYI